MWFEIRVRGRIQASELTLSLRNVLEKGVRPVCSISRHTQHSTTIDTSRVVGNTALQLITMTRPVLLLEDVNTEI